MDNNMNKKMHFVMSEHDPDKLRQANRPEWLMTIAEIEDVTCPTEGKLKGKDCTAECYFCDLYLQHMVNTAQKKLLKYLIAYSEDVAQGDVSVRKFKAMIEGL